MPETRKEEKTQPQYIYKVCSHRFSQICYFQQLPSYSFSRGTQKTNREEAKGRTKDACLNHQMLVDGKIAPSMRNRSVPEMFEAKQVPE